MRLVARNKHRPRLHVLGPRFPILDCAAPNPGPLVKVSPSSNNLQSIITPASDFDFESSPSPPPSLHPPAHLAYPTCISTSSSAGLRRLLKLAFRPVCRVAYTGVAEVGVLGWSRYGEGCCWSWNGEAGSMLLCAL